MVCGMTLMVGSLFVPHGRGLKGASRDIGRLMARCPHDFSSHTRETVSATLSRLKRSGIVAASGSKKKAIWRITERGKKHFVRIRDKTVSLPPEDGRVRLVIFDVPERERNKRDWLRYRLLSCDYTMLQRSVWVGTRPLPVDLRDELETAGLLDSSVKVVGLEDILDK